MNATKTCRLCGVEKPLTDFYKVRKAADGRQAVCAPCFRERRRTKWKASPEVKQAARDALANRTHKTCGRCNVEKPRGDFASRKGVTDGLAPWCRECIAAYSAEHYAANRERVLARSKDAYLATLDEQRARRREWHKRNPGRSAELRAKFKADNPGYAAAYVSKRRAKVQGVTVGEIDLTALPTDSCGICGGDLDFRLAYPDPMSKSLDHIVPIARGGTHEQANLQWSHWICNVRKGARMDVGVA